MGNFPNGTSGTGGGASASGPWQITPEASGCLADGQLMADAAVTSGTNTLTTVGVVNPSVTPVPTTAATGGTILAGTYQWKYTFVSPLGETIASAAGSITTTGSISTMTLPAPAIVKGGAIGYHAYCTAAGGSTFFRQTLAGLPYPFQNNFVLKAPPNTTTPQPPLSNTTASAPFTPADTGKSFRLFGAGAAGADLTGTVTYVSASSLTLSVNAGTTVSGNGLAWGTDNTASLLTFMSTLQATAAANNATAEGVCRVGIYMLATAPVVGGTFSGNCVVGLPNPPNGAPKAKIALRGGSQDAATLPVYQQMWPETSGTCFMYIGPAGTNDATFGAAHVFGTPTNPNVYVTESGNIPGTANMKMVMDSIRVVTPFAGGVGGIDLFSAAQSDNRSCSHQSLGIVPAGGSWRQITANGPLTNQFGWGLREPAAGNNAFSYTEQFACEGSCYGHGPSEHLVAVDVFCAYNVTCFESYAGNSITMVHNGHILSGGAEFSTNAVGALDGAVKMDIDNLRTESTSKIYFDPSNRLQGRFGVRDQNAGGAYKSGWIAAATGTGVVLVNLMTTPGPLSGAATGDPGPPATTVAWFNYYWLNAWVTVSIAGGTFTTLTLATQNGTQVAQPNAAGAATYSFMLSPGWSYTPTYAAGTLTHVITLLST